MRWILTLILAGTFPIEAAAISDDQVVVVQLAGKNYTCGFVSQKWQSGKHFPAKNSFSTHKAQVKALKREVRSAASSKRRKVQAKLNKLKTLAANGKIACDAFAGGGPPPNPTSSPTSANFDNAGNVTAVGKSLFGIPPHLSGNITLGRSIYNSYCTGCHIERNNRTFPVLRSRIAMSPMLYDSAQIPDDMLANLVAYLNRFWVN